MAPQRPNQFKMLLSDEELEMLREQAEDEGLTASDYIRRFIRQRAEATPESTAEYFINLAKKFEAAGAKGSALKRVKKLRAVGEKIQRAKKGQR